MRKNNKARQFLSDISADKGYVAPVVCQLVKCDTYEVLQVEVPELVLNLRKAHLPPEKVKNTEEYVFGFITSSDISVQDVVPTEEHVLQVDTLFEVLSLAVDIDLQNPDYDPDDTNVITTEKVLDLCNKYGLLAFEKGAGEGAFGFSLNQAKHRITDLYDRFRAYMAICQQDIQFLRRITNKWAVFHLEPEYHENISDSERTILVKKWLGGHMDPEMLSSVVYYDEATDTFQLQYFTDKLLSACDTFLSLLIAKGEDGCQNIKVCVECGKYFMGHGNASYCGNPCNRKTAHSRRVRREKRAQAESK